MVPAGTQKWQCLMISHVIFQAHDGVSTGVLCVFVLTWVPFVDVGHRHQQSYRRHRAIAVPSILFDHVRPGMGEFPTGVTGDCPKVNIPVASLDLFIGVWMNWLEDV